MGVSAQKGVFGFAPQAVFDTEETTVTKFHFMRTLTIPQMANRQVSRLPVEIGGQRGSAGSYTVGVGLGDEINFLVRGRHIGHLLRSLSGASATAANTPAAGLFTHTFTPGETKRWLTIIRRVENIWAERFSDCLVGSMDFDFSPGAPLTVTATLLGRKSTQINPTTVSDAIIATYVDTSDVLTVVGTAAEVKLNGAALEGSAGVRRARIRISNETQPDGQVIGSLYQPGFTMTDLVLNVMLDVVINDATLYRQVYYNAATTGAMVASIQLDDFSIKAASASNIPGKSYPYSLEFKSKGENLEYMMLPVALQGANMVVAQLSAQIKLDANNDTYEMLLVNEETDYYGN